MQGDERPGICWPHAGTVGNIAVSRAGAIVRGDFGRGLIACDFSPAGKYRNGAPRWWCRSHQGYWGVKADISAFAPGGEKVCSGHAQPLDFVLDPLVVDMGHYASVRICAAGDGMRVLAAALAGPIAIDAVFPAIAISGIEAVFAGPGIVQVNVTPPALQALADARRGARVLGCLDCARCGYPHLDLGDFAAKEHRRHYCGNCGNDSSHSKTAIVSNPLFGLDEYFGGRLTFA
jgi:hypothetical protein